MGGVAKPNDTSFSISIHALREEGDSIARGRPFGRAYFYPRPPRGGRHWIKEGRQNIDNFYPRPPQGGRRDVHRLVKSLLDNFYPRPPRGGRQRNACGNPCRRTISIHALREEGDVRDLCLEHSIIRFLSTPSARRATSCGAYHQSAHHYFYPRPPRGGRHGTLKTNQTLLYISIHALREEGDMTMYQHKTRKQAFLSTPSARRATPERGATSILRSNFYPRPPRGGRPAMRGSINAIELFLSTPSARRATSSSFR